MSDFDSNPSRPTVFGRRIHPPSTARVPFAAAVLFATCVVSADSVATDFDDHVADWSAWLASKPDGFFELATGRFHPALDEEFGAWADLVLDRGLCSLARSRCVDVDWDGARSFRGGALAAFYGGGGGEDDSRGFGIRGVALRFESVAGVFDTGVDGLPAAELAWLNTDCARLGAVAPSGATPMSGCHWFGGYPTNPFAALWLQADARGQ